MKKALVSLVLVGILMTPAIASAGILDDIADILGRGPEGERAPITTEEYDVLRTLKRVSNWLLSILLIVAAIFIIMAGYFFVTAAGDPEKVAKARNFVLYALVGVLVGFLAYGLVALVAKMLAR